MEPSQTAVWVSAPLCYYGTPSAWSPERRSSRSRAWETEEQNHPPSVCGSPHLGHATAMRRYLVDERCDVAAYMYMECATDLLRVCGRHKRGSDSERAMKCSTYLGHILPDADTG